MKNKAIIFSKNLSCLDKVRQELSKRGLLDFSIEFCSSFEECLSSCKAAKETSETAIVVCKNKFIDELLENFATKSDELSLIFQQAVQLVHEGKRMLFIPIELELSKFLDTFLQARKVHSFSVFGKTISFIESKLEELEVNFEIATKSRFLHTIRVEKPLDERWLNDNFENVILSDDLGKICGEILQEKGLTLALSEQITAGRVLAGLEKSENLKKCQILLSVDDFIASGMKGETLEKFGIISKETIFEFCKKNLSFADISLCVLGDETGKTMLAIGDKNQIHVFSSVFQGENAAMLNDMRDFALFKLYSFLNSGFENQGKE